MGLFTSIYKHISVYTDIIARFCGLSFALEQTKQHDLARNAGIEPAPLVSFCINKCMNTCKNCNTRLSYGQPSFCSRSCSASYNNARRAPRTTESKIKTANSLIAFNKKANKVHTPTKYLYPYTKLYGIYTCHCCHKEFWQTRYYQKCCSVSCRDNIRSQNKCRKTQIQYFNVNENKNVVLQSSWEVKIAEWLDTNNINWTRPAVRVKWYDPILQKYRTYLPDFYLPLYDFYLDVKNPIKMEEDKDKLKILMSVMPLFVGNIDEVQDFVVRRIGFKPTCIR